MSIQEQVESAKKKSYSDRRDYCLYCEKDVVKFARHLFTWHSGELEVEKCSAKSLKSKERRQALNKLKKQWNFFLNRLSMTVRPVKRVESTSNLERDDFLPCSYCLGFYKKDSLYRHIKVCPENRQVGTQLQSRQRSQSDGQTTLIMGYYKKDRLLEKLLFPRIRADATGLMAKKDPLIREFAYTYLKGHISKGHILAIKHRCRQLATLVKLVRDKLGNDIKGLMDVLRGYNIRPIIDAVNEIGEYDEEAERYNSPTVAINFGTWLKQACDVAVRLLMEQKEDTEAQRKDILLLKSLLTSQWANEVSTQALSDLHQTKWNKVALIPLSSDVKTFNDYLGKQAEKCYQALQSNPDSYFDYTNLKEVIYCQLVLLNRRRPGEVAEFTVKTYKSIDLQAGNQNEFGGALTQTEKILLKTFSRIVIRGKRGRGVPILMSPTMKKYFEHSIECRDRFVTENNYVFHTSGKYSMDGTKVIQKHAKNSGAASPSSLRATGFRKRLATITQLFHFSESDLEQLSTFMGHTLKTHCSVYRMTDSVYQTAKVSKLLLLMADGKADRYIGKNIDEIDIDMDVFLQEEPTIEEHTPEEFADEHQTVEEPNYSISFLRLLFLIYYFILCI